MRTPPAESRNVRLPGWLWSFRWREERSGFMDHGREWRQLFSRPLPDEGWRDLATERERNMSGDHGSFESCRPKAMS
jgi:hypothetical protein